MVLVTAWSPAAANATSGNAVAIDAAGRIVVAGDTNNTFAMARYDPDGSLDPTFGHGGRVTTSFGRSCTASAKAIAIAPTGRIVLAGSSDCLSARSKFALAAYEPDGTRDRSFGDGGRLTTSFPAPVGTSATGVAIEPSGRVVAVGAGTGELLLAGYTPSGALDPAFGSGGRVTTQAPTSGVGQSAGDVALDPAGNLVVAGSSFQRPAFSEGVLARYTPAGALDPSFGTGGEVLGAPCCGPPKVAIDASGRIVALNGSVSRYTSSGALDTSFGSNGSVRPQMLGPDDVAVDPVGRIVIAGSDCSLPCSRESFALERLNPDGSVDTTFGSAGVVRTFVGKEASVANAVAVGAGGDPVAAGKSGSTAYPPSGTAFGVARYTPSGAVDRSFAGGTRTTSFPLDTWIWEKAIGRHTATFTYAAGGVGNAHPKHFACALRSKQHRHPRFSRCDASAPGVPLLHRKVYRHLHRGRYVFTVRAIFVTGPDPTPARWRFRIHPRP